MLSHLSKTLDEASVAASRRGSMPNDEMSSIVAREDDVSVVTGLESEADEWDAYQKYQLFEDHKKKELTKDEKVRKRIALKEELDKQ